MLEKKWMHFVGIGGTGMSGIAKVLLELGYKISGSDLQSSETTKRLENLGATIYLGHKGINLNPGVDRVVVSSAIPRNNEEVVKAKELGIPVIQRAEMLGFLMKRQKGIAIAGAHGKTTTSSMISLMFENNNYDPTVVVGGELNDIGGNAKLGLGEYLVAEADESDGSFLKLNPYITVVVNIEDDHLDYYGSKENVINAFERFINMTPKEGFTVLCLDDPVIKSMLPEIKKTVKVITFGFTDNADFYARDIVLQGLKTESTIMHKNKVLGKLVLNIPGKHNISNVLAAIAVGICSGLKFEEIADSLSSFNGVQRRFQIIGEIEGISIYDDYAHHPTELKATIAAARTLKSNRVVVVFQPHRYTRTQLLADEFGSAFEEADILIMNEVYSAGEVPIPGVTTQLIADKVKELTGQNVEYIQKKADIVNRLLEITRPGDLVITLGAGNIWTVGHDLFNKLKVNGY